VRPTFSVIVPCYNYARYLPGCVASVLSQDDVDVSVLIIDDASTDGAGEVASALAASDSRVEVRVHSVNRGHIRTYNEGLGWATRDFTVLLSADDLLVPGAFARAARVFAAQPTVGMVHGRAIRLLDGEPVPPPGRARARSRAWPGPEWIERRCRLGRNLISSPEVVLRTDVQRLIGGYRYDLPHSGDLEMWLRAASHADVAFLSADQAYYRVHPASMSATRFDGLLTDARHRQAAFDAALLDRAELVDHERLHRLALDALARDVVWDLACACAEHEVDAGDARDLIEFAVSVSPSITATAEFRILRMHRVLGRWARPTRILEAPLRVMRRLRRAHLQFGQLWWQNP
jgi:glycosyltransferase involved in cell wall biosynthesis